MGIYKSNRGMMIYNGCLWGMLVDAGILVCCFIMKVVGVNFSLLPVLAILLGVIAAAIVVVFISRRFVVEINEEAIIWRGRNEQSARFLHAEHEIDTYIEIHGLAGVVVYIERYLRVGKVKYPCYNFSQDDFSRMGAFIGQFTRKEEPVAEELPDQKEFRIPRSLFLKREQRKNIQTLIECVIVTTLIFTAWYFALYRRGAGKMEFGIILTCILSIFFLLPVAIQAREWYSYKKKLPWQIILDEEAIQVNRQVYRFSDIRAITMTPTSYTRSGKYSLKRMFVIETKEGKFTYFLGNTLEAELKFEEYETLLTAVRILCDQKKILFVLKL